MSFFEKMFEKDGVDQGHGAFDTIIGGKARFKGELNSGGAVCVNGEFEGKLSAKGELLIAPGSKIIGDVSGGNVTVSGKVEGNITAAHALEITKTGRVHGDLIGGKIVIEEGSSYRGKVKVEAGKEEVTVEAQEQAQTQAEIVIEEQQVEPAMGHDQAEPMQQAPMFQ